MPFLLWSLLAGAAAVIPVALHLLHRRKPKPVAFSSLRFLHEAIAKTRRSRHLTNFLTLLMRMLIMLLLVLAFARPSVRFATWLAVGSRTVVIVVDASPSMLYREGEDSCFDRATEWALNLVRSLDRKDKVALVLPGLTEPRVIFPAVSDHEAVTRALEKAETGYRTVSLVETLNDLLARLPTGTAGIGLEIHVISDFQETGWNATEAEGLGSQLAQREILLFLNHVPPSMTANAGISKVAFYPPAILGDGQFQTKAYVRTSIDYSGGNTLRLMVKGQEQSRKVFKLLPDQTVSEVLAGTAAGDDQYVVGQLELDPDGFVTDNTFRFCLPRLPGIPVLLVDGSAQNNVGARETPFLRHAIQPRGKARTLFLPKTIDWQTFLAADMREYRMVFVCNPPALDEAANARLQGYVRNGGTAVLMPGQHNVLETSLSRLGPLQGMQVRKETLPQEKPMAIVPSEQPSELEKRLLSIMPPPAALVVRRRLTFTRLPSDASMVFQYHDGGAFMFEVPLGQGSLWVTSVSANRDWSEWPLTPFFVVLQQELIKNCARRSLTGLMARVGGVLALDWPEDALELDFRLLPPSGRERSLNMTRTETTKPLIISEFEEPGFYHLIRNDEERMVAVNIPEEESDLSYVSADEIAFPLRAVKLYQADSWHQQQQHLVNLHHGRPLWPLLLCCAFFLAITEELFANVRSRASGLPEALRQFLRRGGRPG